MSFRNVINDGSVAPPRLRMQYNMWAMLRLPRGEAEWTIPQRLDAVAAAGFTGFEAGASTPDQCDELGALLRERRLGIGFQAYPTVAADLEKPVELAKRIGADYLTAQVIGMHNRARKSARILRDMYDVVNAAGLPFFVETHRGKVTQDLLRTIKITRRFGAVRFTGDFSHYVLAGELGGAWDKPLWKRFAKLARRCGNWHGRISNGEQIQTDIGDGSGEMAQQFKKLWTYGMSRWLQEAKPGDVLPFCCELGPPAYSIVDMQGQELSDRWAQSLVIKRLAEEAFAQARNGVPKLY